MITLGGKEMVFPPSNSMTYSVIHAKLLHRGLKGNQVNDAFETLQEWIGLPEKQTKEQLKAKSLAPVFAKEFKDLDELASALAGHTLAAPNRVKEERLAFAVLANLEAYEKYVLDPVLAAIAKEYGGKIKQWESYYGEAATPPWSDSVEKTLQAMDARPQLERLYMKVAFIHDTARNVARLKTPHRGDHADMRLGKWTLVESNKQVAADRLSGVSVWSGTSGSAMDMIYLAQKLGMDEAQLTALAWCIAAFFHFMPTVVSPTHTWHEVMRGARKIIGVKMVDYDPDVVALPDLDFAGKHLKQQKEKVEEK